MFTIYIYIIMIRINDIVKIIDISLNGKRIYILNKIIFLFKISQRPTEEQKRKEKINSSS